MFASLHMFVVSSLPPFIVEYHMHIFFTEWYVLEIILCKFIEYFIFFHDYLFI